MDMTRFLQLARMGRRLAMALAVCVALGAGRCEAQAAAQKAAVPKTPASAAPAAPAMPTIEGKELDRVVAIVNGDIILDSDVDEERRLSAFQPYRDRRTDFSRDKAIERLINRDLILQQAKLQPQDPITDEQVKKDLDGLRKTIPECKEYACETDAGWQKFLQANGFTPQELRERWRSRMEVLRFIEERFRMGIRISPAEIKSYYEKTLLPEYEKQHSAPPKLEAISSKIEEILLQQQVSNLLGDWLKSLRAQGSVTVLKQGEVAP
jgi:peptidyl-prolyl cis-trans isomerase SurA